MRHQKPPVKQNYRQLAREFRNIGCSDHQIISMLCHALDQRSANVKQDARKSGGGGGERVDQGAGR